MLLFLAATVLAPAGAVLAKTKPTGAPPLEYSTPWWAIFCTLVALGGICAVAFKNAKRNP